MKARYRDLTKVPADAFESILARHVPYIRAIRRSEGAVNSQAQEDDLQCVE
jgi:hypothetical protein